MHTVLINIAAKLGNVGHPAEEWPCSITQKTGLRDSFNAIRPFKLLKYAIVSIIVSICICRYKGARDTVCNAWFKRVRKRIMYICTDYLSVCMYVHTYIGRSG